MVNLGGDGTCEVTNLELEPSTGIVYYTLQSTNVSGRVRDMFLQGEGGGEFLTAAELADFLEKRAQKAGAK